MSLRMCQRDFRFVAFLSSQRSLSLLVSCSSLCCIPGEEVKICLCTSGLVCGCLQMALQADTTLLNEGGGLIFSKWTLSWIKGITAFLFVFFNSENMKEASVKLKCNGVQFKCNTVNSKKKK